MNLFFRDIQHTNEKLDDGRPATCEVGHPLFFNAKLSRIPVLFSRYLLLVHLCTVQLLVLYVPAQQPPISGSHVPVHSVRCASNVVFRSVCSILPLPSSSRFLVLNRRRVATYRRVRRMAAETPRACLGSFSNVASLHSSKQTRH